jgi:hypothetical protein
MGFPLSSEKWMLDIKKAAYPAMSTHPICRVPEKNTSPFLAG